MTIDSKFDPPLASPTHIGLVSNEHVPNVSDGNPRILRLTQVVAVTGLKKATIYKLHKNGEFPRNVKLSSRAVGWIESDVQRWITERRGMAS